MLLARSRIRRVRKLFPDWAVEVSRLALRDDAFRSKCEDYGMAVETLDVLETRNLAYDTERMLEYRALISQLERELKYDLLAANKLGERSGR